MINKTRFLYFLILLLLLMNAATLTFMFMHHPPHGGNSPQEVSHWLTEQLKLNAAQQEQYKTLQDEHRKNMESIHRQDRNLHDRFFQLLNGAAADSTIVNQLADSIAANRKQTELTTFYDFKKIRSICNAEQQKKFDEIIGEALRMMGQHPPQK